MRLNLKREILIIIFILAVIVFSAAFSIYVFESGENELIDSYWDALWLSAVTASSVGYGDVYPVSSEGKIIVSMLGFVGLFLIGVTSALFTAFLFRR